MPRGVEAFQIAIDGELGRRRRSAAAALSHGDRVKVTCRVQQLHSDDDSLFWTWIARECAWVGGPWNGPETQAPRRERPHIRIALDADPRATHRGSDEPHSAGAREGIEHGAAPRALSDSGTDHRVGGRIPLAIAMSARQRQQPAQRGGAAGRGAPGLAEPQHVVDAVVPPLARPRLGPAALRLQAPAGPPEPRRDEPVDARPFAAVVAVADHEP